MTSIARQVFNRWALMAVALAAVLAAVLAMQPVAAQDGTIDYPENGKDPVATLTAEDPEGATPITWDIAAAGTDHDGDGGPLTADDAADAASFTIDKDGVLNFNSPPDYEASTSGDGGGDADNDNTYHVVVSASDAATGGQMGYHKVTVKVTNVAETGKVAWTTDGDGNGTVDALALVQFQVGAILAASVTDGDVAGADKAVAPAGIRWQWYRSSSKTAMGTAIGNATAASYTATTDDIGMYLRAEAFYNVAGGREESASLTSDYAVLATRTNNDAPEFSQTAVTRSVDEGKKGMDVGAPVTATDDIPNALNYALAGDDSARFEIDQKTGQIKTLVDLNREGEAPATADTLGSCAGATDGSPDTACSVTVTATDSAGEVSAAANVTINITNVDEKPTFVTDPTATPGAASPTAIVSPENRTALFSADDTPATTAVSVTYLATDPDGLNVNLTLMGADGGKFALISGGVLAFRAKPDYESPTDANRDNVYEVTVRASDGTMYAERMVKVTVTDANEAPAIMGRDSVNYAENGKDPVATLTAEDPEGATPITWDIAAAGTDHDGDGGPLTADDAADAASFTIDKDGVLNFNSPPDYEASDQGDGGGDADNDNTYHVVVSASDAATGGQMGYHKVTVKVTNVAETGKVVWTTDGDGNGTVDALALVQFQVGAILAASVTDGDVPGTDKAPTENLTWKWFSGNTAISGATGATYTVTTNDVNRRLRVEASYNVEGGREESASLTSDYAVLATRTSNDAPEFSPTAVTRSVDEGKKGMDVGAPVTATDDITNALNYALAGDDSARFEIDQKTGQIKTLVDLNREGEAPATADTLGSCAGATDGSPDTACSVTVTATDSAGEVSAAANVTINITNVDEKPTFVTDTTATPGAASPTRIVSLENRTALFSADDTPATTAVSVTYLATDPDGRSLTYHLMGRDGGKFELISGGVLAFRAKPDYESPTDANKDNVYEVIVRASDGTMHTDRMVEVTVTDVNEAPEITATVAGIVVSGESRTNYLENGSAAVATYTARGDNAASAQWTLEGDDAEDFTVSSTSGMSTMLMFTNSPDFENPADADGNNVYRVTVKATVGSESDTHDVRVTVTDEDETPPAGSLLERYDTDTSGDIDKDEAIAAINDYLFGTGADAITKEQAIEVINLYLFGE